MVAFLFYTLDITRYFVYSHPVMIEKSPHTHRCQCRKKLFRIFSLFLTVAVSTIFTAFPSRAESLLCGIDRLEASGFKELADKRVALITNAAGLNRKGESNYILMLQKGVNLKYLMAPEHGFSADIEAGKSVGNTVAANSLPVYSLYGASKKPDAAKLREIDILVFDLQDVGTRCYTYISTMKLAMEACEAAGVAFMVLDRPNPIIPMKQDGFMVASGYDSFVGAIHIPFIHSMTVGEIALFLKAHHCKNLDLRVIPMQGYSRERFGDEYPGFNFLTPSPNIRSVNTAIVYPATVFLEATTLSEGRGTDAPFMQFGAPFINNIQLADGLKAYRLPGVNIESVAFRPLSGKYKGELCNGLKFVLADRKAFLPFRTATALLLELESRYPGMIIKDGKFFDLLAGTPRFREMLISHEPLEVIMDESRREIERFNTTTPAKQLYR